MHLQERYLVQANLGGYATQYTSSTSNSLADQFCEQPAASGRHQFSKSNLSWMDMDLKRISQGDDSEQRMPKT
jgi:hypothetical protein